MIQKAVCPKVFLGFAPTREGGKQIFKKFWKQTYGKREIFQKTTTIFQDLGHQAVEVKKLPPKNWESKKKELLISRQTKVKKSKKTFERCVLVSENDREKPSCPENKNQNYFGVDNR
jgi:hypothetical protein